jgi:hypothetical protein
MDIDFAYLLGAYLGDGNIYYRKNYHKRNYYQFILATEDIDFCQECSRISNNIFNKTGKITKVKNYYKLVICSKLLCDTILKETSSAEYYENATYLEKKHHFPNFINNDLRISFLSGLMDADGWIGKRKNGKYTKYDVGFKNTALWTSEIYNMFIQMGLKCGKLNKKDNTEKNGNKLKDYYCFSINAQDYISKIGFRCQRKKDISMEYYKYLSRNENVSKKDI